MGLIGGDCFATCIFWKFRRIRFAIRGSETATQIRVKKMSSYKVNQFENKNGI